MKTVAASVALLVFIATDLTVCITCAVYHYKNLTAEWTLSIFSPFSSVVDLMLVMIFRLSFACYLYRKKMKELSETDKEKRLLILVIIILVVSPFKLLLLDENFVSGLPIWDAVFVLWSMFAMLTVLLCSRRRQNGYERLEDDSLSILWKLVRNILTEWKLNLMGAFSLTVCAAANVFIPYFVSQLVTNVIRQPSYSILNQYIFLFVVLGTIAALAAGLRASAFEMAHWKLFHKNRLDLYSSYLSQEVGFFDEHRTGTFFLSKVAVADACFIWLTEGVNVCMVISVMWYGGHLVLRGKMLLSFLIYQLRTSDNLVQMSDVFEGFMKTVGASRKVFSHIEREPKILYLGSKKPQTFSGTIEFREVSFSYPSRPTEEVLKNVSFSVPAGATVALVGASGSGKSSIISLLSGFYRPTAGGIFIDGIPLEELDRDHLHSQMSLVKQEPTLFSYSVMENIRYGVNATDEECIEAAEQANADGFVRELPQEYRSDVGECGGLLSGGQKQRVAIARAIVRKPQILLLDEATSALDGESERTASLEANLYDKTILLVAHRLSTVQNADQILVMEKGEIVQMGTHDDLKHKGVYRRLLRRQMQQDPVFSDAKTLPIEMSSVTGPRLEANPIRFSPKELSIRKSL